MFALKLFWQWTNVIVVTPGNVCLSVSSPNALAVSASESTRARLSASTPNAVAVSARSADDCEC